MVKVGDQKGKGIEDTQSSNAFWIAGLGEKGRGRRAKKAKCGLRWAGGQSRGWAFRAVS